MVYDAGGKLAAEYAQVTAPTTANIQYVTNNYQGSTSVVTDQAGNVKSRHDYLPFGEEIGAGVGSRTTVKAFNQPDSVRQKYAGMETDTATGMAHTLWRKQDNWSGRWTSPDPYGGSMTIADPQSFNRYAYCDNDPVNKVDLAGLYPADIGFYQTDDPSAANPDWEAQKRKQTQQEPPPKVVMPPAPTVVKRTPVELPPPTGPTGPPPDPNAPTGPVVDETGEPPPPAPQTKPGLVLDAEFKQNEGEVVSSPVRIEGIFIPGLPQRCTANFTFNGQVTTVSNQELKTLDLNYSISVAGTQVASGTVSNAGVINFSMPLGPATGPMGPVGCQGTPPPPSGPINASITYSKNNKPITTVPFEWRLETGLTRINPRK